MSKLQNLADRIRDTKKRLDDEADKIAARLDGLDKMVPDALGRAHVFIEQQQADVDSIERTLTQLSNLPLDGSAASQKG